MRVYVNPLRQLRSEMDRVLNGFFLTPMFDEWIPDTMRSQPAVNIWDQGEELTVEMEVPGVKSDQIDVSVMGEELNIKVDRPDVEQEGVTYHRRERPAGSFSRVVQLPCAINTEKVAADLHEGVLTLHLPKAEAAKPHKITVATA
jgi:HSP20 family protein